MQNSSTDSDYKKDLLTYALKSGGKVIIHFVNQHQKEYRIEKIYGQKENLYCVETGELLSCSIDSVFDNIIYYGQNDLSNKNRKFEDDLLFKLIKVDTQLQTQIENKKKEIKSVVFQLTTLDEELKQRFELEQEIKNIIEDYTGFWAMDEEAIPCNYFTIKVNVASSESANNAINQDWYNRF